jgi:hypothetical protein
MDCRLSLFQKLSPQNFFIKKIFGLVLYKTDFLVLKFKNLLAQGQTSVLQLGIVSQHLQNSINNT